MNQAQLKPTKKVTKKSTKRIVIDYTQNSELESKINLLESRYSGLTRAEIAKLAVVELFQKERFFDMPVDHLTEAQEQELAQSIASGVAITLTSKQDIKNFVNSLGK
jgi:hypothetical protein